MNLSGRCLPQVIHQGFGCEENVGAGSPRQWLNDLLHSLRRPVRRINHLLRCSRQSLCHQCLRRWWHIGRSCSTCHSRLCHLVLPRTFMQIILSFLVLTYQPVPHKPPPLPSVLIATLARSAPTLQQLSGGVRRKTSPP